MRRTMKLIGLFSCMHALLAITFLLMAFGTSMRRFDTGQVETAGERAISRTADVLFLPASLLWTRWASETFPDVVEWVLFTANSVLWGSVLALIVTRIRRPLRAQQFRAKPFRYPCRGSRSKSLYRWLRTFGADHRLQSRHTSGVPS